MRIPYVREELGQEKKMGLGGLGRGNQLKHPRQGTFYWINKKL